ncbi:MAG: ATP-binding protein [Pseudomonadota bacterium]
MERSFPATAAQLPDLLAFIEDSALALSLPGGMVIKLLLVVEELFLNTVHHGGPPAQTAPVRLQLQRLADAAVLRYEDSADAYNPFTRLDHRALDLPLAQRPVGQLGVILISGFATQASHSRIGERNCIEIRLAIAAH